MIVWDIVNMRYCNAWIVRSINRLLLIVVAIVTVMWMVFLLDMNAASTRKTRMLRKKALENAAVLPHSNSEEFNDGVEFNRYEKPPEPKEEFFNPPAKAPEAEKDEKQLREVPQPEQDELKEEHVKRNINTGDAKAPRKSNQMASIKSTLRAKNIDNNLNDGIKPSGATNKVVDAKMLTKFTLKDMKSIPALMFSKNTASSCFCVNNGQNSEFKMSAEDALLAGCPKRDDLQLRCLPRFFLAGCNNCGTTDLQYRLNKHQLVLFGAKKEPDFWTGKFASKFSTNDTLDSYTSKQYGESTKLVLQALRDGKKLSQPTIGEMAPTLYYSMIGKWGEGGPSIPVVLKRVIPDAKFIFLLRNPIDRCVAMYNAIPNPPTIQKSPQDFDKVASLFIKWYDICTKRKQWEPKFCLYGKSNTTDRLRPPKSVVYDVINSIYHIAIREWIRVFGKENILVLKFEDYMTNRVEMIQSKVLPFLRIKRYTKGPLALLEAAESNKTLRFETDIKIKASNETRQLLKQFFEPHNKKLATLVGDDSLTWA